MLTLRTRKMAAAVFLVILTSTVRSVAASEDSVQSTSKQAAWHSEDFPSRDRGIIFPFARVTYAHALRLTVDHRTFSPFTEDPFATLFGYDAPGSKFGIGLRYGLPASVLPPSDVGFYRLSNGVDNFDTYQFDLKVQVLSQDSSPVDMALGTGFSWFAAESGDDRFGGFAQLLVSRLFFERLTVGTGLLYHSNVGMSSRLSSSETWSIGTFLALEYRITEAFAWNAELGTDFAGYTLRDRGLDVLPSLATGPKLFTMGHTFAFVLSTNEFTSADSYFLNTARTTEDLILGFTITRELNL